MRRLSAGMLGLCACVSAGPAPRVVEARGSAREQNEAEPPPLKPSFMRGCRVYAEAPVEIDYQDAPGGATVIYRTRGNVAQLRARTREVARFHNGARGKTPWLHDLYALPHRASVVEIEGGAKLILVPKSVGGQVLEKLRVQVQQDVWHIQSRGCPASQEGL